MADSQIKKVNFEYLAMSATLSREFNIKTSNLACVVM